MTSEPLSEAERQANDQRPPWQMLTNTSRKERTLGSEMTARTTKLIPPKNRRVASEERKSLLAPSGSAFRKQGALLFSYRLNHFYTLNHVTSSLFWFSFSFHFPFFSILYDHVGTMIAQVRSLEIHNYEFAWILLLMDVHLKLGLAILFKSIFFIFVYYLFTSRQQSKYNMIW